jgi:aminoglycoside phosphotransferase (APT) family kinase protein
MGQALRTNSWELDKDAGFLKMPERYKLDSLDKLYGRMAGWIHDAIRGAKSNETVLLHYDFHFDNVLVDNDRIIAVLDWCEARTGEAAFEVAWANLILHTAGGDDLIEPFVSAYKRHSGRRLENLTSCEVLSGLRQLSDILRLRDAGALSLNKRADAAALVDIGREMMRTINFIEPRTGIDLHSFLA